MDSEFIDSYITLDAHPPIDHSPSDPPSNSMSPVPSAASTPPTTTTSTSVSNLMASSFAPVPLSSQPAYPLGVVSGYPRRAEHSYLHHHHTHHHQHLQPQPHPSQPYSFGAPPPPPFPKVAVRAPQLPTGPVSAAAIMQQQQTPSNGSASASDNLNINEPDAPPPGTGGSRKRPKYTRSKKGCLTCRSKKIKCDERKPMCTRCEHGHRECTWPEAVLPRRPKGAVRGVGDENDAQEEDTIDVQRRPSIPGSAVSTQFPSSATSTHFNGGIPTNSPFEPAPPRPGAGRDVFESDVYPAGSQFSMPIIPANARSLYPRAPGSADFYPVTTVNGQPIDDYEFPPRQQQQQQPQGPYGSASGSGSGGSRGGYSNSSLYAAGPPGAVPGASYNGDLRRASWDSSAPTDGRRPSWDANSMGAHASSVSSPASSTLGLGLGGILPRGAGGSSSNSNNASGATAGSSGNNNNNGLMLFQSPDPLSPFFRSVQERNLVGFDPLSNNPFSFNNNSYSSSSSSPFSSSPASSSSASSHYTTPTTTMVVSPASYDASTIPAVAQHSFDASSPVLSNASSSDFGITADGVAYRKNSYPHLLFSSSSSSMSESSNFSSSSQPLTIDPPAPIAPQGVNLRRPSVDLLSLAEKTGGNKPDEEVEWLAPPSMDIVTRPFSSFEEESFASWSAYS